jgi:hypothetical protein
MSWVPVAGSILEAGGVIISGIQEKKAQEYNARVAEQQAEATRIGMRLTEYQKRKQYGYIFGTQRAGYAKAGVKTTTGSPLDVMLDSIANAELDIAIDRFNTEVQAMGYESEAELRRYYGKQALYGSIARGGMTLLKAGATYASNFTTSKTTTPGYYKGYKLSESEMQDIIRSSHYKTKIGQ